MPMIKRRAMCYSRNTGCSFSNPGSSANCFAGVVLNGISAVSREASVGSYFETAEASFLETSHVATMQSCFALLMTRLLFLSFRPFLAFMTNMVTSGEPKQVADLYLKELYAENQKIDGTRKAPAAKPVPGGPAKWRDMRTDFLNRTNLRNDLEVFTFKEDSRSFGAGGIKIKNVCFTDEKNKPVNWIVGGEIVKLHVECLAKQDIHSPIVGFYVNDKLGQKLFGDNTCLTYLDNPLTIRAGEMFSADFTFVMPLLPKGHYSVLLSAAEGTQKENVQHEWMYEALLFESHASSVAVGLAGIPMHEIKMTRLGRMEEK